jgi:hypothetical protein
MLKKDAPTSLTKIMRLQHADDVKQNQAEARAKH